MSLCFRVDQKGKINNKYKVSKGQGKKEQINLENKI